MLSQVQFRLAFSHLRPRFEAQPHKPQTTKPFEDNPTHSTTMMSPRSLRCVRMHTPPPLISIPEHSPSDQHLPINTDDPVAFLHTERKRRRLPTLDRCVELDLWAQVQALQMANQMRLFHSVQAIDELKKRLGATAVGENVQRGDSIFTMLCETMDSSSTVNRSNLLSEHFAEFGSATVTGRDGKIYFCQVFRGREC